jgi:hypothetical protein
MRLKILIVGALTLLLAAPAAAKFMSYRLKIEGPGMESPVVIKHRRLIDRIWSVSLVGRGREHVDCSERDEPAYELTYRFEVADDNGSRITPIHQVLYPFAEEPFVFTPSKQKIPFSYGDVHFKGGCFSVQRWVLRELEDLGLPSTAPRASVQDPVAIWTPSEPWWRWILGVGTVVAAGGAVLVRRTRRRSSSR